MAHVEASRTKFLRVHLCLNAGRDYLSIIPVNNTRNALKRRDIYGKRSPSSTRATRQPNLNGTHGRAKIMHFRVLSRSRVSRRISPRFEYPSSLPESVQNIKNSTGRGAWSSGDRCTAMITGSSTLHEYIFHCSLWRRGTISRGRVIQRLYENNEIAVDRTSCRRQLK